MATKPRTTNPLFRSPQLATAIVGETLPKGQWVAEEKYDGWRLIVAVSEQLHAWSRNGICQLEHVSKELRDLLVQLPHGIYDGELVLPGGKSTDVADHANIPKLEFVLFDILDVGGLDMTTVPQSRRRGVLEQIYLTRQQFNDSKLHIASYAPIRSWAEVQNVVDGIWSLGGEGIILKDTQAPYKVGKRTKTFLKIKQCLPAVLEIIGFADSDGEVNGYGMFGTAVLRDTDGVVVPVKVLDDTVRARLKKAVEGETITVSYESTRLLSGKRLEYWTGHPWDGRKLHIEYQNKTDDGSYRHPRWDRLDGE